MALEANPVAARRTADLVVDVHADETIVFDTRTDAVHCLPTEIATVWKACDGFRNVADIVAVTGIDREIVESSVEQLTEIRLIESAGLDRRRFLRRAVLVGGSVVAIPVIQTIIAPAIAAAASTCSIIVQQTGCVKTGNRVQYSVTVTSSIRPLYVVVAYKTQGNNTVTDSFTITAPGTTVTASGNITGAAVPQPSDVHVFAYADAAHTQLICDYLTPDLAFDGNRKDCPTV